MSDLPVTEDLLLFRELFDRMPQLGWTARPDGFIDFYNRGWYEYTGTTFEQMQGWGWTSVHDPAALETVTERWKSSIATGNDFEMEFRLRRFDGELRWFLTRVRAMRDQAGVITRWVGINTDITATRELQHSLERERVNLRELFALAPAFMAKMREPSHIFEVVNPAYMRLIGEDRDVIGLPALKALPEVAGQGFVELLDEVYASGKPYVGTEMPVTLKYGDRTEEKFVDFVYQATRDRAGRIDGVFAHGTDVTAQVRARQVVERQATALEQANHVKDEFLATLSHELRTPITAVLGWARLLSMGLTPPEVRIALDAIEKSAEAQAQLIEDVLDVSRVTSGKLTLDPKPVDLVAIAQAAVTTVHPTASARNIEMLSSFPSVPAHVSGDEGRLQQVIWNLLANAVKFTPKGGNVTLRVEQSGSLVRLTVSDTGIGIDPAFLPHLFEPFRQADSSSTREHGGIGLGMAIVRKLVELHGGTVSAQSEGPGRGATFTVELPVLESQYNPAPRPRSTALDGGSAIPFPELTGRTILVVDDQDFTRDVVVAILRRAKATVFPASSVREGLALFEEHRPDSVVCDVAMPHEDGYVFVREVRALGAPASGTPIVALTAFGRPEDRRRALKAGFSAYLTKPVEPLDLVETVKRLIP